MKVYVCQVLDISSFVTTYSAKYWPCYKDIKLTFTMSYIVKCFQWARIFFCPSGLYHRKYFPIIDPDHARATKHMWSMLPGCYARVIFVVCGSLDVFVFCSTCTNSVTLLKMKRGCLLETCVQIRSFISISQCVALLHTNAEALQMVSVHVYLKKRFMLPQLVHTKHIILYDTSQVHPS